MHNQFTVSVFVIDKLEPNFKILLIHHKKFDKWMVPGGHIESIENQIEASKREVLEETGVSFDFFSFRNEILNPTDSAALLCPEYFFKQFIPESSKDTAHYHLDFTYLGVYKSGELTHNKNETKGLQWVSISDLDKLNMFDGTRVVLHEINNKLKSATTKYEIYE